VSASGSAKKAGSIPTVAAAPAAPAAKPAAKPKTSTAGSNVKRAGGSGSAISPTITYVLFHSTTTASATTRRAPFAIFAVDGGTVPEHRQAARTLIATGFTTGTERGILGYGVSVSNANRLQRRPPVWTGPHTGYYTVAINSTTTNKRPVLAGFTSNALDTSSSVQAGQLTIQTLRRPSASNITGRRDDDGFPVFWAWARREGTSWATW